MVGREQKTHIQNILVFEFDEYGSIAVATSEYHCYYTTLQNLLEDSMPYIDLPWRCMKQMLRMVSMSTLSTLTVEILCPRKGSIVVPFTVSKMAKTQLSDAGTFVLHPWFSYVQ